LKVQKTIETQFENLINQIQKRAANDRGSQLLLAPESTNCECKVCVLRCTKGYRLHLVMP